MSATEEISPEMTSNMDLIGRADVNDLEAILAVTNTDRDETTSQAGSTAGRPS